MKTTINERVRMLRTYLNQTQQEFSHVVGVTPTQLSRIENGESSPQKGTIKQIIDSTGVNSEWLFDGIGELKVHAVVKQTQEVNNPYRDYTIQKLEKDITTWQEKYNELFQMFNKFLDRGGNLGKPQVLNLLGAQYKANQSRTSIN